MAISFWKTAWAAAKGYLTGGSPGAAEDVGESIVKQEMTGVVKTAVTDSVEHKSDAQIQKDVDSSFTKITK